jgi:hypothetical protein
MVFGRRSPSIDVCRLFSQALIALLSKFSGKAIYFGEAQLMCAEVKT